MDFFYDGQIRRYITQFMRVFIGFKYQAGDGEQRHVPVSYGDMSRQVAAIIKENSENKMPTVPKIACYITGLEMDKTRLADPTFVSKVQVRERAWDVNNGQVEYQNYQGGGYTVERLMPTPFTLKVKADIWTSNTDQKLQLLEQILVLFNPSLEIQTTDNYIDWTSLSVIYLNSTNFSSRQIPQGTESEIDIASLEFEMPIWITPPAKVKKLGVVRTIISNMFMEDGSVTNLNDLVYNGTPTVQKRDQHKQYNIIMIRSNNGNPYDFEIRIVDTGQGVDDEGNQTGDKVTWEKVLEQYGGWKDGVSRIIFLQPTGYEIFATFALHPMDPLILVASVDPDTIQSNTLIISPSHPSGSGTIDAIINPYNFNPLNTFGSRSSFPVGLRYLMLDDVNTSVNRGGTIYMDLNHDNVKDSYDGPDAWKNLDNSDPYIKANSIIEWTGTEWVEIFDPIEANVNTYITNLRTGVQYKWDGVQWLKSFEGEYAAGYWRLDLDPQ